ncbi:hypothetical protein [Bradyrhizobium sp. NP1]|uniref:hypothetical protein n=1 Tax=Bradyrhizobium sp. NP1 TaxID=3049772 RepID=UPI0025A62C57|nr:hypothetical protein [Bradyrhizobium sp. NP1]WJR81290.1 hypothetical protein QOU61_16515 [Bradyrhizobium sp. NP1]
MDRFNLGAHSRTVSTTSREAQRWFDLGLNWCYGFNKAEGVRCFRKALEFDPGCVMAHWGIAFGSGPFYNLTWREHGASEADACTKVAYEHIRLARSLAASASDVENRLVEALARRFQSPHAVEPHEFDRWDDEYAAEMRNVHNAFPDDDDVTALYVEALLMRTPRRLWNMKTGMPAAGSDVVEALEACERAMDRALKAGAPQHPAIVHLHIHATEMSNEPERSMAAADALAPLCPDAGHLNHMPGHVYVLCGLYDKAIEASARALRADNMFLDYAGPLTFYTVACCHDLHLMMHTCMLAGRYAGALAAADKIRSILTREVLSVPDRPKFTMSLEGYFAMRSHVMVRFGRWQEIIDEPELDDPELYRISTPMQHYAKAVAYAYQKRFSEADEQRARFHQSVERLPPGHRFFNNPSRDILAVGAKMLEGELEYHRGNHKAAYECLRESVRRDDNLEYIEPWAWMHPPRHALAALLMEQGHLAEAEAIYRDDLGLTRRIQRCAQHPDNVWALHGLVECLERRNEATELPALRERLAAALSFADVPITSSCMCRAEVHKPDHCCSARR